MRSEPGALQEWRQSGAILPACLAGVMLCAVHGYSLGVMIGPLEREFGWARAEIATGMLIISAVALFAAPMVGVAIDRFGPRRIGLFGVPFYCASLALLSTASDSIWSWWSLWVLLAIANMFVLPSIWATAITSRFVKSRGLALAVALSGTGLTAAVIPFATNALVEAYGWRGAYVGLAIGCLVVALPLIALLFHSATDVNRRSGITTAAPKLSGVGAREAMRSPTFLKLAGAMLLFSLATCALTTNGVPVLIGQGFDPTAAAAMAGLIGIGSIMGRLLGGVLLDRFDPNSVAAISVLAPVITASLFLGMPTSVPVTMVGCFILGLSVGTEYDACAYLAARHFGLKSFGTLFGTINGLALFTNGVAPMLANLIFDRTQSYDAVLWFQFPACIAAAFLFKILGPYPDFAEQDATAAAALDPRTAPAT